jgi:hypothetical protein
VKSKDLFRYPLQSIYLVFICLSYQLGIKGEVENSKDKREIEISSSDVPIDGKNERIAMDLKQTSNLKS